MSARVTIVGAGTSFEADPGESILDAALRAGTRLRYGCRQGKCSTCKHYVVAGEVDDSRISAYALLDEERAEGATLLCQAFPVGDCQIELSDADDDSDQVELPVPRSIAASFAGARPLSRSIWSVDVELAEPLPYIAGQYVEIAVPGHRELTRAYSIASPPSSNRRLELAVKRIEGGAFSGQLDAFPEGSPTTVRGPFGEMYLRPAERPVVLIGAGSGIGPLIGILRAMAESDSARPARLLYGARTAGDLPYRDEIERLGDALRLETHFTLSAPDPGDRWTGDVGRVTAFVGRHLGDETDIDVYACGRPEMCDDIRLLLEARGVPPGRIHVDGFYASR